METKWLSADEREAWLGVFAVLELLPAALDAQLRRESELTRFEYYVLAMLSERPDRTLQMTGLAALSNATLPRLSHVVRRLSERGLVDKEPCPGDGRATNVRLTDAGWDKLRDAAPAHVATVRRHVIDALTSEQVEQLTQITQAMLASLDPDGAMKPPQPAS